MDSNVLVSRAVLEQVLDQAWNNELAYPMGQLEPGDAVLTLAVEAGLPLPAPMKPGTVPPAPPQYVGQLTARTYRQAHDHRLRCVDCGKVVYSTAKSAAHAAESISVREPMYPYLGNCGHYHVSRRRK